VRALVFDSGLTTRWQAGGQRKRKRGHETYKTYVNKTLKTIHPEVGLSKKSAEIINDCIIDVYERITVRT
jgi:histone H2B